MQAHQRFSDKNAFPFPLLVDEGTQVADAYGARKPDTLRNERTVVGIDKAGTVVYYQRGMPSTDAILAAVTGGG